jgi:hypothetical protein
MKNVMISCHVNITKEQFEKYYIPEIDKYLHKGYNFIVGGALGTYSFAQEYLNNKNIKVIVYKGE